MIEYLIVYVIFSSIGRLYLFIRYWDSDKRHRAKDEKYAGEFSNAGRVVLLNIFVGFFGLLLFGGLVAGIIGIVRHDILK